MSPARNLGERLGSRGIEPPRQPLGTDGGVRGRVPSRLPP
jgi:hypothetical protein